MLSPMSRTVCSPIMRHSVGHSRDRPFADERLDFNGMIFAQFLRV
jgi:hypothetical protein